MIKSFTVTNYLGDTIKLDLQEPEKSGFLIESVSGIGPSKSNINTTEVSTSDGSIFNSARMNQRNIVLQFIFIETVSESIEYIRQKSYKYFPVNKNIELLIETDNRIVKTTGYVESNEPNIFSSQEGTQISIICPDPYFYSAGAGSNNTASFNGIEHAFEFPFSNESLTDPLIEFGIIRSIAEKVITYLGDAEVGITIRIHATGDASNIVIHNIGTREMMGINTQKLKSLNGSGIIKSDDIVITTSKGDKGITLIRDGKLTNILNCLDKNTDWFSLSKGNNFFAVTAETGLSNLQFQIDNKIIYEGV